MSEIDFHGFSIPPNERGPKQILKFVLRASEGSMKEFFKVFDLNNDR